MISNDNYSYEDNKSEVFRYTDQANGELIHFSITSVNINFAVISFVNVDLNTLIAPPANFSLSTFQGIPIFCHMGR